MSALLPAPVEAFDLAQFCRRIIIAACKAKGISDSERKERIMLARECGFLTDEETKDMIVLGGLVHA
ncbi:MAG: hypothetical protein EBU31_00275 [Proteobacteria bacterium]|nr:hypothetical protein [Pseudomonadota bacterium]